MDKSVVFRPKRSIRLFWAVFPVLIVVGVFAMMTWIFGGWAWLGELGESWIDFLALAPILLVVLLVGVTGYMAAVWWTERIIFADTFVERRGVPHLMLRKGRLAYEDVLRVRRVVRNVLLLEPREGKPWIIAVRQYEAGFPGILEQIRGHVAAERIEPGLEESLTARDRRDRSIIWLNNLGAGFVLVAAVVMWSSLFGLVPSAWSPVRGLSRSLRVESYAIADDGSVWVLTRDVLADLEDLSDLTVRRLAPQGDVSVRLPPTSEVSPPEAGISPYFAELRLDRGGRPWVEIRFEDLLLLWTGEEWQIYQAPEGLLEPGLGFVGLAGGELWYSKFGEPALVSLDPVRGSVTEHFLGGEEGGGYLHVSTRSASDSLMASDYRQEPEGQFGILVDYYAMGVWSGWIAIEMPPTEQELGWPETHAVDREGNLYLLLESEESCYDDALHAWLGRWHLARQEWEWRSLAVPERCREWSDFTGILVDPLRRPWVQSRGSVAVYPASVFEAAAGDVQPLLTYNEDNSGFDGGRMQIDGRGVVWAGGDLGAPLWIDASVGELPRPLPGWLAFLLGTPWGGNILMYLAVILILVSSRRLRRGIQGKRESNPP